ncbi:hypothetical protein [Streptomyces sp. NPDC001276]|uniref:hypothetical protein n=1 Tax=Streptomyces sp. NPDC001276 TaxID=3364555 RepID=UPI0036D0F8B0
MRSPWPPACARFPWPGGRLLAADRCDWGFTAFALAGVSSMVFIGIAALRAPRNPAQSSPSQDLLAAS